MHFLPTAGSYFFSSGGKYSLFWDSDLTESLRLLEKDSDSDSTCLLMTHPSTILFIVRSSRARHLGQEN
jgi:hypothetical protein